MLRLTAPVTDFPVSRLNGPGLRWVLWVQGCSLHCTRHCLNPEYLPSEGGHLVPVSGVLAELDRVHARHADLEGVTFLGGEPFDQAEALAVIGAGARQRGLSVMTYTGWTLERLHRAGPAGSAALLVVTDILKDGPFLEGRFSPELRWRGSDNQRLILLTTRYRRDEIEGEPVRKGVDATFREGALYLSGLQDRTVLMDILRRLHGAGFRMRPEDPTGDSG